MKKALHIVSADQSGSRCVSTIDGMSNVSQVDYAWREPLPLDLRGAVKFACCVLELHWCIRNTEAYFGASLAARGTAYQGGGYFCQVP